MGTEPGREYIFGALSLRKLNPEEYKDIYEKHLKRDFPKNELRPFHSMQRLFSQERYLAFGLYDSSGLCVYGSFITGIGGRPSYMDYFGVEPKKRQRGLGSLFLKLLPEVLDDDAVILEAETVEGAADEAERLLRRRRLDFYKRAGARITPASGRVFGVDYSLLCLPLRRDLTDAEAFDGILHIYKSTLPRFLFKRFIHYQMSSSISP
ncbi:MAG: hypothetical protein ACOX7P_00830 [Oscillospiraceae bacterium]|jgi:GNAT superfamily N-acetyltransferase